MTPSGMWNRDCVRLKSVIVFSFARGRYSHESELFQVQNFMLKILSRCSAGCRCVDIVSRLDSNSQTSAPPIQDRTETDTHDLPSDFRLERRLCEWPQYPRWRALAGGLGAARSGLSR